MKKKIILIAGGGCLGHIPLCFLKNYYGDYNIKVDVIGGTSIGGILSLCLASNMSPNSLFVDFHKHVDQIFSRPWYRSLYPFSSKYPAENIEKSLKELLPGKMSELRLPVIVPSVDFRNDKPKVFDNLTKDNPDNDLFCWQVARSTSAAPTYFPPYKLGTSIMIDGGIVENIPIVTVATCLNHKMNWDYSDMDVLVLGTGKQPLGRKDYNDVCSYSSVGWLKNFLIPYVTKSNEIASTYWGQHLGFNSLVVFDPVNIEGALDDVDLVLDGTIEKKCARYYDDFHVVMDRFLT